MTALASPPVSVTPSLPRQYTEKEWRRLADDGVSEFVGGQVVEKVRSTESTWTAARVTTHLSIHLMQTGAGGDVLVEQSFRCVADDPRGFRRPDVAFVAAGRVPTPPPGVPAPVGRRRPPGCSSGRSSRPSTAVSRWCPGRFASACVVRLGCRAGSRRSRRAPAR